MKFFICYAIFPVYFHLIKSTIQLERNIEWNLDSNGNRSKSYDLIAAFQSVVEMSMLHFLSTILYLTLSHQADLQVSCRHRQVRARPCADDADVLQFAKRTSEWNSECCGNGQKCKKNGEFYLLFDCFRTVD